MNSENAAYVAQCSKECTDLHMGDFLGVQTITTQVKGTTQESQLLGLRLSSLPASKGDGGSNDTHFGQRGQIARE